MAYYARAINVAETGNVRLPPRPGCGRLLVLRPGDPPASAEADRGPFARRPARGQRHPFVIHGWVLLPDHLHCLWQLPEEDADYGLRWSLIKRLTSQAVPSAQGVSLSRRQRREPGLWPRRFWEHRIRDETDYRRHMDYLHWNPVRHGLVERVDDWPWSSYHRLLREGVYPAAWGGAADREGAFGE